MATLLEDLKAAADVLALRHGNDIETQLDSTLGGRLRDHARRLREEMAPLYRPELKGQLALVRVALERINGGPLSIPDRPSFVGCTFAPTPSVGVLIKQDGSTGEAVKESGSDPGEPTT